MVRPDCRTVPLASCNSKTAPCRISPLWSSIFVNTTPPGVSRFSFVNSTTAVWLLSISNSIGVASNSYPIGAWVSTSWYAPGAKPSIASFPSSPVVRPVCSVSPSRFCNSKTAPCRISPLWSSIFVNTTPPGVSRFSFVNSTTAVWLLSISNSIGVASNSYPIGAWVSTSWYAPGAKPSIASFPSSPVVRPVCSVSPSRFCNSKTAPWRTSPLPSACLISSTPPVSRMFSMVNVTSSMEYSFIKTSCTVASKRYPSGASISRTW